MFIHMCNSHIIYNLIKLCQKFLYGGMGAGRAGGAGAAVVAAVVEATRQRSPGHSFMSELIWRNAFII